MNNKILIVLFLVVILMTVPFKSVVSSEKLLAKEENIDLIEWDEIFDKPYTIINLIMLNHRNNPEIVSTCQEILTLLTSLREDSDTPLCDKLSDILEEIGLLDLGETLLGYLLILTAIFLIILWNVLCADDVHSLHLGVDNIATFIQLIQPSEVNRCPCE